MTRSKYLLGAITLCLVAVLLYFYGGSAAPSGQPPLVRLTPSNIADIKSSFNAARDEVRILALLSPT